MKQFILAGALALGLHGATAFGVVISSVTTCAPVSGVGPIYQMISTSGGAPGYPVNRFTVVKKQAGFADVSSEFDRTIKKNEAGEDLLYSGTGVEVGSAKISLFAFSRLDGQTRRIVNDGYISIYIRASVGASIVDVQLPAWAPNAAYLNTTPPLTGYDCQSKMQ